MFNPFREKLIPGVVLLRGRHYIDSTLLSNGILVRRIVL